LKINEVARFRFNCRARLPAGNSFLKLRALRNVRNLCIDLSASLASGARSAILEVGNLIPLEHGPGTLTLGTNSDFQFNRLS